MVVNDTKFFPNMETKVGFYCRKLLHKKAPVNIFVFEEISFSSRSI